MNRNTTTRRRLQRRPLIAAVAVTGCAAALAVSGGAASAAGSSQSNAPYTVNFGNVTNSGTLAGPWGYAYSEGLLQKWFKAYGVTIKVSSFANGPLLTAAMVGGSVDFGSLGDTPTLIARAQGLRMRLISETTIDEAFWIFAQSQIHSLSQLAGKTVAVEQGSVVDLYLQALLAQKGLLKSVHRVAMLNSVSQPAFEKGSIDAVALGPTATQAFNAAGTKFNVVAKSTTTPILAGTGVAIATDKFLAAHPDFAKDWNAVRVKSVEYAKAHASAYYVWASKLDATTVKIEKESSPLAHFPIADFTPEATKHLEFDLKFLSAHGEAKPFSIPQWELHS